LHLFWFNTVFLDHILEKVHGLLRLEGLDSVDAMDVVTELRADIYHCLVKRFVPLRFLGLN
jgi:hypothetical protein